MKKSFTKGVGVVVFAVLAISIIIIGSQVNKKNQYQQRVEFAEASASKENERLNQLEKQVANFYADDEQIFLVDEITTEQIEAVRSEVASVKISASDYAIEEKDLPEAIQGATEIKAKIYEQLIDIQDKAMIQEKTNQLFTESITNWQEISDIVIDKESSLTASTKLREDLSHFPDSPWKSNLTKYLEQADSQTQQVTELQETLEHYLKDGVAVSYEEYMQVSDAVSEVPNEEIRTELNEQVKQLASDMGLE